METVEPDLSDAEPAGGAADETAAESVGIGDPEDWRDGLAAEERRFAEQFAAPADAVRSALDYRRKLSTSIQVPDADAGPEARLEVFNRLGRPADVDGYEIAPPANLPAWVPYQDEAVQKAQRGFLEAMHGAGATQEMVDAALAWYWNNLSDTEAARDRALETEYENAESGLRREWGRDFEKNLEHASRAVAAYGGRELGEALEQFGLSSHPAVVRAFARIGRTMGEDDMISGSISDTTRDQLKQRAEDLVAEDDYWSNETLQREMRQIMLELYGDAEIGPGAR